MHTLNELINYDFTMLGAILTRFIIFELQNLKIKIMTGTCILTCNA